VTVNVAAVLPEAKVTEAGTVNAAVLPDKVTVAPAALDTVTVHVALAPAPRLAGLHANPLSTIGTSEVVAVCVLPFSVAVMVAVWLAAIAPAVTMNVAVVLPDGTVTEAGAVNAAALPDKVTVAPAALDKVTVHVALAPDPRLAGLHVNPLNNAGAVSEIAVVCGLPFSVAVTVAVWLLAIVPAVAVKVAAVLPDPTVTAAGTVNAVMLQDKETTAPPTGAGASNETVHVSDPPVLNDTGTQLSALTTTGTVIATPRPVMGSEFASALAPKVFVTAIAVLLTPDAIVTLTTATTPFCITEPFMPASAQV
jgi:hypothetical protein